ncbi:MAG TPA: hypothetical protein VG347_00425 [Verrucomicrobiae bacterium]|nr:hypothetical protein [Verrucomicrobiae bacterium]
MKTRKLSQIRPDKTRAICDTGYTINELAFGKAIVGGLGALIAGEIAAADPLRGHSRAPVEGLSDGCGWMGDAGLVTSQSARCAGRQGRSATLSTLSGFPVAYLRHGEEAGADLRWLQVQIVDGTPALHSAPTTKVL